MFRKIPVAAFVLCFSATSNVLAIGLGGIEIQSTLNNPLNAVIELTSASAQELGELKVSIPPRESFDRVGIPRPPILDDFNFTVEQSPGGKASIRVTTRQPVREPFLDFLIEASWSKGRLLRQYTLLVDPPVTMPAAPPPARLPVRGAPPTLSEAEEAPPPRPRVPAVSPAMSAPAPAASGGADKYGPVKRNETLWEIAKRVRPDSDISMEQMMLALQRANPESFAGNNINNLKAGATLRIPERDEILSVDRSAARHEAKRQYSEWQQGRGTEAPAKQASATEAAPKQPPQAAPPASASAAAPAPAAEAHLQLVAPEDETLKGGGAAAAPAGDATTPAPEAKELLQQLALATEEAEAGRAQSQELQSRVGKLEEQVSSMQRLLELKDAELANLQQRLAAQNQTQAASAGSPASPEAAVPEGKQKEKPTPAKTPAREGGAPNALPDARPGGVVDRLLDNPVLTGLGVLVAMILGGFLWASTRHRRQEDIFNDEPTLASQLAAARHDEPAVKPRVTVSDASLLSDLAARDMSPLQGDEASDPLTEADVFIAYGRVQQAEEVIKNALQGNPGNRDLRMKLIEIYHAAGNTAAFDVQAALFRETIGEDDPDWKRIASMGGELSPANPLYQAGGSSSPVREGGMDFDMDLSGMEVSNTAANAPDSDGGLDYEAAMKGAGDYRENIDFNLDELNIDQEEEDIAEGLLPEDDEVGTKLDLARAYMDMGDTDGARGILEEVIEEGNNDQKNEAENLISQLA